MRFFRFCKKWRIIQRLAVTNLDLIRASLVYNPEAKAVNVKAKRCHHDTSVVEQVKKPLRAR